MGLVWLLTWRYSGFPRIKIFANCPCPDFLRGNFHESSIAITANYIILTPVNAVIVFNNYIVHFLVWRSLSKQSPLCGSTNFTRMYGPLQLELCDYTYSSNLKQFLFKARTALFLWILSHVSFGFVRIKIIIHLLIIAVARTVYTQSYTEYVT